VFDRKRVTSPGSVTAFPLTVLDAHGQPIEDNVYAASVTIWNSGNPEIKRDDLRIPFRVTLEGNPRLIDITPTFFTRDNVDRFSFGRQNVFHGNIFISNVVLLVSLAILTLVRLYLAQAGTRRYVVAEVLTSKYVLLLLMFLPIGVIVTWILDVSLTKRTIPPF